MIQVWQLRIHVVCAGKEDLGVQRIDCCTLASMCAFDVIQFAIAACPLQTTFQGLCSPAQHAEHGCSCGEQTQTWQRRPCVIRHQRRGAPWILIGNRIAHQLGKTLLIKGPSLHVTDSPYLTRGFRLQ